MNLYTIILAAGSGKRMSAGINKILLPLGHKPVLAYSLAMWQPFAAQIIVAAQLTDWPQIMPLLNPYGEQTRLVSGGFCRAQSLSRALEALPAAANDDDLIAVHDAARPLTAAADIQRVITAARHHGAAILAAPVTDTIRYRKADGLCGDIVPREQLIAAQTPQIFRRDWLVNAYARADEEQLALITDDACLIQAQGHNCVYVTAEHSNIKLTTPEDLIIAEAIWQNSFGNL